MKHTVICLIIFCLLLTGCNSGANESNASAGSESSADSRTANSEILIEPVGDKVYSKYMEDMIQLYNIHVGDMVYENQYLVDACEPSPGNKGPVVGVEGYRTGDLGDECQPIIIIRTKENTFVEILDYSISYQVFLYLNDIDGDGEDEVIVDSPFRPTYSGSSTLHIFKVQNNELLKLVQIPSILWDVYDDFGDPAPYPYETMNFGFTSQLLDNYKAVVEFPALHYKKTFELPEEESYWEDYDKKSGKLISDGKDKILFDRFENIDVEDFDGDGVYEIVGRQGMQLATTRYIEWMKVVLKYNVEKQQMEVIEVGILSETEN